MGSIPCSFVYIFEKLKLKQMYNNQLLDLLNPSTSSELSIKTEFLKNGKESVVYVEGLT